MSLIKTVREYAVPGDRDVADWGTVERAEARALQRRLDELINEHGLLGLQVSVKNRDGRTWHGASGTADLGRRIPLTTDHVMRIASATKLFTSVVALHLVDAGVLSLEDTVDRWLPAFPRADRITVGMLLSHTSGIGHPPFTLRIKLRLLFSNEPFTLDELVALAAATEPCDDPGRSHRYSNANHHLLGAIAQAATGEPIADLLDEAVFSKLGLSRTALLPQQPAPAALVSGFDNVYTPSLRPYEVTPGNLMLASHANTSGGMVSTAAELATFIDGLFGGRLLSDALLRRMTTIAECSEPAFHHTGYGLGVFRIQVGDVPYLGHLGLFVGSQALMLHNPRGDTAIAAVGNLSDSRIFDVVERFADVTS